MNPDRWLKSLPIFFVTITAVISFMAFTGSTSILEVPQPADSETINRQKVCAFDMNARLVNGIAKKITIQGQVVLLCCKSCAVNALKNPDQILKNAHDLRMLTASKRLSSQSRFVAQIA